MLAFERSVQPKLNHAEKEQCWSFIQLLTKLQAAFGWNHALHYALLAMEVAVEANDSMAVTELKMGHALMPFVQDIQRRSQHAASHWALTTQVDRGQARGHGASANHDGKRQRGEYDSAPRREQGAPPRRELEQHEHAGEQVSDRGRSDARVPTFRFDPSLTCHFHEIPGHDPDGCYVYRQDLAKHLRMRAFPTQSKWFASLTVAEMENELARAKDHRVQRLRPLLEAKRQQQPPQQGSN
jgi:hypothetical protein